MFMYRIIFDFYPELPHMQRKCLKECTMVAEMQEMVELNTLPMENKQWVMEKKPETC